MTAACVQRIVACKQLQLDMCLFWHVFYQMLGLVNKKTGQRLLTTSIHTSALQM